MADILNIAVIGCLHGELQKVYETLGKTEIAQNSKIDLVLCCGDFQSPRDESDLESMAIPPKHRRLMDFCKYYDGTLTAPYLTIFIGGNHEASNYLCELPYGGWIARNIYYMGHSNVLNFAGLRIGGISGIFKSYNYNRGHFEVPPFDDNTLRSVYHVRKIDVDKLLALDDIDVLLSHDWPTGIWQYGDLNYLLSRKPYFENDIDQNVLGCRRFMELINCLKPWRYFCAHLHTNFSAIVPHDGKTTEFLALDKVLPRRVFYHVFQMVATAPKRLCYDPKWLAITKLYAPYHRYDSNNIPFLNLTDEHVIEITNSVPDLGVPDNFQFVQSKGDASIHSLDNPQTSEFCKMISIENPCIKKAYINPDEIDIS